MNKIGYAKRKETYEKALEVYGLDLQVMMAIEEMSELTKELCKLGRGKGKLDRIVDEIADVTIMCEQLRQFFSLNQAVCERMDYKITRLRKNLGMGEEDENDNT